MYTNKYYDAVVQAKLNFDEVLSSHDIDELLTEDFIRVLRGRTVVDSINKRAVVATVLTTGSIVNGQFMMPSTKDCLNNFRHVRKALSKGRKLHVTVYDGDYIFLAAI